MSRAYGTCPVCGRAYRLRTDGRVTRHKRVTGLRPELRPACAGSLAMPTGEAESPAARRAEERESAELRREMARNRRAREERLALIAVRAGRSA